MQPPPGNGRCSHSQRARCAAAKRQSGQSGCRCRDSTLEQVASSSKPPLRTLTSLCTPRAKPERTPRAPPQHGAVPDSAHLAARHASCLRTSVRGHLSGSRTYVQGGIRCLRCSAPPGPPRRSRLPSAPGPHQPELTSHQLRAVVMRATVISGGPGSSLRSSVRARARVLPRVPPCREAAGAALLPSAVRACAPTPHARSYRATVAAGVARASMWARTPAPVRAANHPAPGGRGPGGRAGTPSATHQESRLSPAPWPQSPSRSRVLAAAALRRELAPPSRDSGCDSAVPRTPVRLKRAGGFSRPDDCSFLASERLAHCL